ncbi:MAG: hypothetical protein IKH46_07775 [Lachnospiraceae bacterium]|nr:hypothetical protein [Lachnospiraceae bacterium]
MEEEIVFEQRTIWSVLRKMLLPGVILLIVLAIFFCWCRIDSQAHHVMQEARDIRVAMRLTALESAAAGKALYAPERSDGMIEGAAQKIRELTYADGKIMLTGWDDMNGLPRSFTYRKGSFMVEYKALGDGSSTDGQWDIYYEFHVLTYTTAWGE